MARDINKYVFDDSTKLKLDIFGECFEEWLPVFNNDRFTEAIYIFDFFAGSGKDAVDTFGSPLVLLNKAKGDNRKYCAKTTKPISFIFNESKVSKSRELQRNTNSYIENCKDTHRCNNCIYRIRTSNEDFQTFFSKPEITNIFSNKKYGKFVILDQYGFSQIDDEIFSQLISFPRTDFIFFISSSFINRFKEHPNVTKYIDTSRINFESIRPNEIHRAIADYFKDLIPPRMEYFLHHFSIQKDKNRGNYYGLIFGTNHSLGMEKFLKVCWKYDKFSGEANYNIDNNFEKGTLFYIEDETIKKNIVEEDVITKILSGVIKTNHGGFKYVMYKGCLPKLFTDVVKKLEREGKIQRTGELNYSSTNIHRTKCYSIKVLNHGA